MANLTISIPDDILERARARALAQGTSVNNLVRERLEAYASAAGDRERVLAALLASALEVRRGKRGVAKPATRDSLHER